KAAAQQASQALQKDPQNAAARDVAGKAQDALKRIDTAVGDGNRALAQGDVPGATRALEQVRALAPRHPALPQFREKLNGVYRGQAETAQAQMKQSQKDAAKATTQADYKAAVLVARDADALLQKGEFVNAAQRFHEAADGFARARRAAEAVVATPVPGHSPPGTPTLPTTTTTATTLQTLAVAPPPPTTVNEEPAVRRVLAEFERAFETGDVALWKQIRPGASDAELKALAARNWKDVNVTVTSVDFPSPAKAVVHIARRDLGADGKTYPFQQTLVLVKEPGGWKIQSIGRYAT